MASMTLRQRWLPILLSGIFVVAMAAVSDIASCSEILFPEITAIVCGAWIQPHQAWNIVPACSSSWDRVLSSECS
jgi:hypothetical protein